MVSERIATPLVRVTGPDPRIAVPSLKVIVPVALEGTTVAVRVTLAPSVEGFGEEVSMVPVARTL